MIGTVISQKVVPSSSRLNSLVDLIDGRNGGRYAPDLLFHIGCHEGEYPGVGVFLVNVEAEDVGLAINLILDLVFYLRDETGLGFSEPMVTDDLAAQRLGGRDPHSLHLGLKHRLGQLVLDYRDQKKGGNDHRHQDQDDLGLDVEMVSANHGFHAEEKRAGA